MERSSGVFEKRRRALFAAAALVAALSCALCLGACGQSSTEPQGSAAVAEDTAADAGTQPGDGATAADSADGGGQDAQEPSDAADEGSGSDSSGSGAAAGTGASDDSTHGDSLDADRALEGQTGAHPVVFTVKAPGYGSSDGKIPVAVSGTRSDGTAVDATAYVDASGSGLSLAPGEYTVTVIESPLVSGGRFLRAPGRSWDVTVADSLAEGESVSARGAMTFTKMSLSQVTADEVETAYTYAVSGGLDRSTAKKYKAAVLEAAGLS